VLRLEKTVFLSYRRTDQAWALAIFQNLTNHGFDVFFDYTGIGSGDFEQVILANIRARAHFVVVLTPSALKGCADPQDWVRREIEAALQLKRNIVPVMIDGFDFGSPSMSRLLSRSLAALKKYNGLTVPAAYFEEAMKRLRDQYLNVALDAVLHPASVPARQAATNQKATALKAPPVAQKDLEGMHWLICADEENNLDQKIAFLTNAIRSNPTFAFAAYDNRGAARDAKADLDGAIQDFSQAIRLKPDDSVAFLNRGLSRFKKGELDLAIRDFSECLRQSPNVGLAFLYRGMVRARKGDLDGAIEDYSQAIRLDPADARPFFNRGNAFQSKGALDLAIRDFTECLRLSPGDALAFYNRGNAWFDKKTYQQAVRDYGECIRLRPDYAGAFNNRSLARNALGDFAGAKQDRDQAARLGYRG
jgi:tetratricopeptide (TPR) repeat protein